MAVATLPMPAAHASGPPIAAPLPVALDHHAVLALDLGTTTGWALRLPRRRHRLGHHDLPPSRFEGGGMRYLRFRGWLGEVAQLSVASPGRVRGSARPCRYGRSTHIFGGFSPPLAWCEERALPTVHPGRYDQALRDRPRQCRQDGDGHGHPSARFRAPDDNEADAIALLLWSPRRGRPAGEVAWFAPAAALLARLRAQPDDRCGCERDAGRSLASLGVVALHGR